MKLVDLLINQKVVIQLIWGEQKIEFSADVVDRGSDFVYVSSYVHNGSDLKLNVTEGAGVICNVFADDFATGQRISWRNVELTSVDMKGRCLYCIKTRGFNNIARPDDRRYNGRTVIQVQGEVYELNSKEFESITVRDISGVGVAFYAPASYVPKSQKVVVKFSDDVDGKIFDVKVECAITRTQNVDDKLLVGCRLSGENRDYQLYRFIKHLRSKNGLKNNVPEADNQTDSKDGEKAEVVDAKKDDVKNSD